MTDINKEICDAVQNGDFSRVKDLIDQSVELDVKMDITALNAMLNAKNWELIKYLEKGSFTISGNEVWNKICKVLAGDQDNATDIDRELYDAAEIGEFDRVKHCIAQGADVNANHDDTVLDAAIRNGYFEMIQYLVEHGAMVNQPNNDSGGQCPILRAIEKGNKENDGNLRLVKLLVEHGANVNVVPHCQGYGYYTFSPLIRAVDDKNLELIQYLVEHEADINMQLRCEPDKERYVTITPLHWAIEVEDFEIVKYLVEHGADVNGLRCDSNYSYIALWTEKTSTPLESAATKNHPEMVHYLKEHGAKTCIEFVKDCVAQGAKVQITKMNDGNDENNEHVSDLSGQRVEPLFSRNVSVTYELVIDKDDRQVFMYFDSRMMDEFDA